MLQNNNRVKNLLIIAYEYQGYHSKQGTALARRTKQVAESFAQNGWNVTAIHKDQLNESGILAFSDKIEPSGVRRIAVKSLEHVKGFWERNPLTRKLYTIYCLAFKGDRTYKFGEAVLNCYDRLGIQDIDLLITFYTPRGTIYAGNTLASKKGLVWIADIQDPFREGIKSGFSTRLSYRWIGKALKVAKAIVHVSPEWAKEDGTNIHRNINVIRHAIPEQVLLPVTQPYAKFTILYAGSLDQRMQSVDTLNEVFGKLDHPELVKMIIAGNDGVYDYFRQNITADVEIENAGWLQYQDYQRLVGNVDCCLVVPWWTNERVGIPSKFFDLCQFNKPVWIIGRDSGAFASLLAEWGHPPIPTGDVTFQVSALQKAMKNDFSGMFNIQSCKNKLLYSNDIYNEYLRLL